MFTLAFQDGEQGQDEVGKERAQHPRETRHKISFLILTQITITERKEKNPTALQGKDASGMAHFLIQTQKSVFQACLASALEQCLI